MKIFYHIFCISILLITIIACSKEIKICDRFEGWTIISEDARGTTCHYHQIFIYQDKYYTTWNCCECDIIPMAIDCNGDQLCDFEEDCMDRFFKDAE